MRCISPMEYLWNKWYSIGTNRTNRQVECTPTQPEANGNIISPRNEMRFTNANPMDWVLFHWSRFVCIGQPSIQAGAIFLLHFCFAPLFFSHPPLPDIIFLLSPHFSHSHHFRYGPSLNYWPEEDCGLCMFPDLQCNLSHFSVVDGLLIVRIGRCYPF